jgi:TPR repeat protein
MDVAKRFWFEGAVRGNPLAQTALWGGAKFSLRRARVARQMHDLLLAAVLFGLAAQQGNEQAMDSLKRLHFPLVLKGEYDSDSAAMVQRLAALIYIHGNVPYS